VGLVALGIGQYSWPAALIVVGLVVIVGANT